MQIETKKYRRTPIIVTSIIALLLIAVVGTTYSMSYWPFSQSTSSEEVITTDEREGSDTAGQDTEDETKGPIFTDEPTETAGGGATLTITQLTQVDSQILLRAQLENVADGGRCIAYFSSNGGEVAKYTNVSNTNGELMCSLDANALEFNYLGEWSVRLVYTTPDNKKVETTGDIAIQ